ncbi:MAG: DeoR/GlpR transcriptional regulator [Clostridia bacterium]|nr:DeoR/GlpR transcriptional regulator [Clostridia bacterium]
MEIKLSKEERYTQILEILRTRNNVTVNYLAKRLFVSPSTIRRDYQVLQARGLLHRSYGKATLNYGEAVGLPIELRRRNMPSAKLEIGRRAVDLIKDGDIIFIDASSTALCMVEHLERFNYLTVITNGLNTLHQLQYFNNITVYSLGGLMTTNSMAFTGQLATDNLSHLHIDKCFFSTTGVSPDGWLMDAVEPEHLVLRTLLKQSDTKVYLCDSSKIGKTYLLRLCEVGDVDYIISDADFFELVTPPENGKTVFIKAK